jgi:N-acetylmuramoyl-L-alanine amidase
VNAVRSNAAAKKLLLHRAVAVVALLAGGVAASHLTSTGATYAKSGKDAARGELGAGSPPAVGCVPGRFRVALDVGHTPEASGATSARGVAEFVFNLELAKQIQRALIDDGFIAARLNTAHGIGRGQLVNRTEQANGSGAELLLSIHHDDVQNMYHSVWMYNGVKHQYSDRFSGYSLFVSADNRRFEDSLAFAKLLGTELATHGMQFSTHHAELVRGESRKIIDASAGIYQYDQLFVLKHSLAPAVLLEAGIIVNRADESVLASPEGRDVLARAVQSAVRAYCMMHQPG